MHSSLSKSTLVQAVAGDLAARENLLREYRPLIRLAANHRLSPAFRRRFDESDVVQLTCLDAAQSLGSFRGRSREELLGWLETILERNVWKLTHRHRAQKRDIGRDASGVLDSEPGLSILWKLHDPLSRSPASKVIAGESAVRVAQALERLPAAQREAIELRFLDGLKLREVAEQMETSVGCIAGLLRRGLARLYEDLPEELNDASSGGRSP